MLVQKYDVVVTNPPYMGGSGMNARLSDYVKKVYPDSKSDLFAVFIERCAQMDKRGGYQAMITQHAWMFLSSFEKLRAKLQLIDTVNMAHLGARGFDEIGGEVVQTTSFVLRSSHTKGYKGTYCRLIDGDSEKVKAEMFVSGENRYVAEQDNFSKIPGSPVAYWVSSKISDAFENTKIGELFPALHGFLSGHDEGVTFMWYEVNRIDLSLSSFQFDDSGENNAKYVPLTRGGEFKKWYGNYYLITRIDKWAMRYLSSYPKFTLQNKQYYFKEGCSWPLLLSGTFNSKLLPNGFIFGNNGPSIILSHKDNMKMLGFLNSCIVDCFIKIINPTISCSAGVIKKIPIIKFEKWNQSLAEENCAICKKDWDSFETSWDFKHHPLV